MDFLDVQILISIKLLLLLFIAISFYLIYLKKSPVYFLALAGLISAASYFLLVNDLQLPFWGLQGDEITLTAMYNTFAHVNFSADFAYHSLPSFYPPASFWLFGLIGRVFNLNGIVIFKLAAFSFFLFFPVGLYYFQKYLIKDKFLGEKMPGAMFIFLVPLLIITILDKDLLFGKPYEVIAAATTIFWYISLYLNISQDKLNNKKILIYGIIAGLIFMTYYLWLIFAAIALFLLGVTEEKGKRIKYFFALFKTMIITLIVASPFLVPLTISYFKNGMESWQTAFFTPNGLDLWLPMFKLNGINSLILLFGFLTIVYYRSRNFIKQLLFLLLTAFLWWGLGMISLLIFKIPFQEFRGFYILAPTILAIGAAYGLERLFLHFHINENRNYYITTCVLGVMYFASQSIFGFFVDDPIVRMRRVESRNANQSVIDLINYLKQDDLVSSKLTLQTTPQILAFLPINHLIYFNQHNNNPAAIFSERYDYVQSLANSQSPDELYNKIKDCSYGKLKRFIFFKDNENYYLYFHLDKIIKGIEEKEIKINQKLFISDHFNKVYDKDGYVVIDVTK
ncbi:MAG: arabinofuranosyltransferase [Patescibacteria group bacterium]